MFYKTQIKSVTQNGAFKQYKIAQDEWLVNDDKKDGVWIVRTMKASAGNQRWYTEIWRDYDSRREVEPLEYNTPIFHVADFDFPVQDDYRAKITNCDAEIDKWQFGGISDADNKPVIGAILQDENDAHKWNMSLATLKGGAYLFGIHDGALYKIDKDGNTKQVGGGLKNFRLRELKRIGKAKK